MVDAIRAATGAMLLDIERIRIISQNISNVSTPGYRAETPLRTSAPAFAEMLEQTQESGRAAVPVLRDERAGALKPTQRSLDFALEGPGYFQVETPDGLRYTRRGDFGLDAQGRLVTLQGFPVLGTGGVLQLPDAGIAVDTSGIIRSAEAVVGSFAIAVFDEDATLHYDGQGLFASEQTPGQVADPGQTKLRQGSLESSNVRSMDEMVRLIETTRHLGLSAQALRAYDQILDAAINQAAAF